MIEYFIVGVRLYGTVCAHELKLKGNTVVNYTEYTIPNTIIIEHKHHEFYKASPEIVISKEYSATWKPGDNLYYQSINNKNNYLYKKFKEASKVGDEVFGGRLGQYKYYKMDKVIKEALNLI